MKIIYNSKEVANNTSNYNELLNKPMINSVELEGNLTTNDLGVWPVGVIYSSAINETPRVGGTWEFIGNSVIGEELVYHYKRIA